MAAVRKKILFLANSLLAFAVVANIFKDTCTVEKIPFFNVMNLVFKNASVGIFLASVLGCQLLSHRYSNLHRLPKSCYHRKNFLSATWKSLVPIVFYLLICQRFFPFSKDPLEKILERMFGVCIPSPHPQVCDPRCPIGECWSGFELSGHSFICSFTLLFLGTELVYGRIHHIPLVIQACVLCVLFWFLFIFGVTCRCTHTFLECIIAFLVAFILWIFLYPLLEEHSTPEK